MTKRGGRTGWLTLRYKVTQGVLLLFLAGMAMANPEGGVLTAGSATITQPSSTVTQINQNSQNIIMNWQSFNIKENETTQFVQPNSNAVALNRINPTQGASQIYGQLTANGKIILVNQSGIFFGPNSHVDVAGLIASTANISDDDFNNGHYIFIQSPSNGTIINQGYLKAAQNGLVALIGNNIRDDGTIEAQGGTVLLAAGKTFVINLDGNQLVNFVADDFARDAHGNAISISAKTAKDILDRSVNLSGISEAQFVGENNGDVILSNKSIVNANHATKGGSVFVLGKNVSAQGNISATGNSGGFVETSGNYLNVNGIHVETNHGTWLLDPFDITISTSATINPNTISGGSTYTSTGVSNVNTTDLANALTNGNVTIQTGSGSSGNGDIAVNAAVTWASTNTLTLSATRNIYLNADITATNGGLTLSATNGAQSITAGTIGSGTIGTTPSTVTANINVANFVLSQGQWFQSSTSLPTFNVTGNFTISESNSGTFGGNFAGQFTRIDTTGSNNGIDDIFGLQGVATGPSSTSYVINNNIDASVTSGWNAGGGFVPIGNSNARWSGNFNGNSRTISNLKINGDILTSNGNLRSGTYAGIGLLSETGGGVLQGFTLVNETVTASNFLIGGLVGWLKSASVSNSSVSGSISANGGEAGGLVGVAEGGSGISNSYSIASVTNANNGDTGGFVGQVSSITINNSWSSGAVSGTGGNTGGFAGSNLGTLTANLFDTTTSGISSSNGCGNTTNCSGVTGATTSALTTLSTYTGAGWSTSPGASGSITSTPSTSTIPNYTWFIFDGKTRPILISELGTPNSAPSSITIYTAHQLQLMGSTLGATYTLGNNLDLSATNNNSSYNADIWGGTTINKGFVPIGNSTNAFSGTFNGNSYYLSNLYINLASSSNVGLFGQTSGATISNIGLVSPIITGGSQFTGSLVGNASYSVSAGTAISNAWSSYATVTSSSGSYVGGLVGLLESNNNQVSSITTSWASGTITALSIVGGLTGENQGAISDSYSLARVNATASGGSSNFAGGLTGTLFWGGSIPSSLTRVYAIGSVSGTGTGKIGGLVGSVNSGLNTSTITNAFWDSSTTGQPTGVGNNSGNLTAGSTYTAGCFTGSGCLSGSANLSSSSLYSGAGWSIANAPSSSTWGIMNTQSYPYLTATYGTSTSPRAISGSSNLGNNITIQLAKNGSTITTSGLTQGTTTSGANGFYYFLEPSTTITSGDNLLVYATSGSTNANAVTLASSGTSVAGLTLTGNNVTLGDNNTNTITNTNIATAKGSLSSNILYSTSGANLTINSSNTFTSSSMTTYQPDGNLTMGTGLATFNGPINLAANSIFTSSNSGFTFSNTVDGSHAFSIANNSGTITFSGIIGGNTALSSLTIGTGDTTSLNTTAITTSGAQSWGSSITLGSNMTFTSTSAGGISFNTLDGTQALTIANGSGTITFNSTVGSTTALASLTIGSGSSTTINTTTLRTSGAQTWNSSITLGSASPIFSSTNGSGITFNSTIGGARTLTISANSGNITFNGILGGSPLSSILVNSGNTALLNAASVTTTGTQTWSGGLTLGTNVSLANTNSTITLSGSVSGSSQTLTLSNGSGSTVLGSLTSNTTINIGTLNLSNSSAITLRRLTLTTNNSLLNFNNAITLSGAATTLNAGGGGITFGNTINGAQALTISANSGNVTFNGTVGATTALSSLTINSGNSTTLNTTTIKTSGAQTWNSLITLNASPTFTSTGGNGITFGSTINGTQTLSIANSSGITTFNGNIMLTSLSVGTGNATTINTNNITTTGAQTYSSAVTLGTNTTLSGSNLNFGATITGTYNLNLSSTTSIALPAITLTNNGGLTVSASGAISQTSASSIAGTSSFSSGNNAITLTQNNNFTGAITLSNSGAFDVGLTNAIATSLATSSIGRNFTLISGGSITQTGIMTATASTSIASTAANSDVLLNQANDFGSTAITFSGTLSNIRDLNLRNINSSAVLPSNLSSLTNLRNLIIQFDNTSINIANSLTTSGTQTYVNAVKATGNITLTSTGDMTFGSTLDDNSNGAHSVTLNSAGVTTFNDNIGNTFALGSITTNSTGSSVIKASSVTTTGSQTFNDAVTSIGSTGTHFVSTAGGTISLANSSNNFTTSTSAPLSINISGGVNHATIFNANALVFGTSNISDTLNVTTSGAGNTITQKSGTSLTVNTLNLVTNNSSITLTNSNSISNLNVLISGAAKNNFTFTDPNPLLTITGIDTSSGGGDIIVNHIGSILVTGAVISGTGAIALNANAANESLTINNSGSVSGTGGITFTADNMTLTGTTNAGSNSITLQPYSAGQLINLGGSDATGTLGLTQSELNTITAGTLNIGKNSAGTLTINSAISSNNADINLVGSAFINNVGSNAISTGTGKFLIWTVNPANDTLNSVPINFKQYSATFGSTTPAGSGNGALYTIVPSTTLSLTGTVRKIFDGTNAATLTLSNYTFGNTTLLSGDVVHLSLSGLYAQIMVGSYINVSVSGITFSNSYLNGISVYGYNISDPLIGNIGFIDPNPIIISVIESVTPMISSSSINSPITAATQTTSQMVSSFIDQQTPVPSFNLCN